MDKATIRVNQETLSKFVGNLVRFVGQLKETQNGTSVFLASDGGEVVVHMNEDSQYGSSIVEIIGTVNPDLSIQEMTYTDFGDNFDIQVYNEFVNLSHKHRELFY